MTVGSVQFGNVAAMVQGRRKQISGRIHRWSSQIVPVYTGTVGNGGVPNIHGANIQWQCSTEDAQTHRTGYSRGCKCGDHGQRVGTITCNLPIRPRCQWNKITSSSCKDIRSHTSRG